MLRSCWCIHFSCFPVLFMCRCVSHCWRDLDELQGEEKLWLILRFETLQWIRDRQIDRHVGLTTACSFLFSGQIPTDRFDFFCCCYMQHWQLTIFVSPHLCQQDSCYYDRFKHVWQGTEGMYWENSLNTWFLNGFNIWAHGLKTWWQYCSCYLCFEHHPCIVIYMLEGQKRKGEVKKLEALSVHQLINNQRNICSDLKTVGRRTAFCDKSTLWGDIGVFFLFFLFPPPGIM